MPPRRHSHRYSPRGIAPVAGYPALKAADCCYHEKLTMVATRKAKEGISDRAGVLAQRLSEGLVEGRVVPRFVDSYVVERGRYALQVHPGQYRDLLAMLQREALLAISAQTLEMVCRGTGAKEDRRYTPLSHKDAASFRQKFLAALSRQQHWNVGSALEFQTDLQMYESILARAHAGRRSRKPFEAANHPFVDRCAFLLDSSFLEDARLAASRALANLEALTTQLTGEILQIKPRS